ncbi:MAG: tetratricopeptide repeat protein [Deltaproteobacteria bacterium]|nr:tetratricopeptide repeat protein [Deltaproteobacteria bacterium]
MITTQPGTGIPKLAPGDDYTALAKPKAMIIEEAKPRATIVDDPKPKASISSAETVATPALVPTAATPAAGSGISGLPAMPPGATAAHQDDLPTINSSAASAKVYPEVPVQQEPSPPVVAAPVAPSVDPSAAVSLPRPRTPSRPGTDRNSAPDMLADWGWKTDSQAAVYDGDQYEDEAPNTGHKRLLIAIGGALGAILLIVVIAVAASGGDDKNKEKAPEAPIADTSRTAESANAKLADPAQAPAPTDPASSTASPPTEAKVEPAPIEPGPVQPAAVDTAAVEAARLEAAKADAAKTEAAKLEAAKADAATAEAAKLEAAKADAANQKIAKAEAAKAETARIETAKADAATQKTAKLEAARLAKIEAANIAAARAADAARIKAERAEAAKAARLEAARNKPVETAKALPKEPKKKEPKLAKVAGDPVDPYAEKAAKADPSVAYKTGFQQYVRGDTSGALATFKTSLSASPGYPPTWRGLGLVYEKMGQKSQAKKSFQRYLQLSPKASDAEQIRDRLERLGS